MGKEVVLLKGLNLHYSLPSHNVTLNFKKAKVDKTLNIGQFFISDKLETKFDLTWKLFFLELCYHFLATLVLDHLISHWLKFLFDTSVFSHN